MYALSGYSFLWSYENRLTIRAQRNIEYTIKPKDKFVFSSNFYQLENKFIIRKSIVFHVVLCIDSDLENLSNLSYDRT